MTHSSPDTLAISQVGDTPDQRVFVNDLLVLSLRAPLLALSNEFDRTKRALSLVQTALGAIAVLFMVDATVSAPDFEILATHSADQVAMVLRKVIPAAENLAAFVDEVIPHWTPTRPSPEVRRTGRFSETRASRLAATRSLPKLVAPPAVVEPPVPAPNPRSEATPTAPKLAVTPAEPQAVTPPSVVATLEVPKPGESKAVAPERDFAEAFKSASRMLERHLSPEERAAPLDADFLDAVLRIEGIYDPTRIGPFGTALRMEVRPGTMSMRNVFGDAWTRAVPDPNVHYRAQYFADTWLRPKATRCDDFWRFRPDNFLVRLDKLGPADCATIKSALSRDRDSLREDYVAPAPVSVPTFAAPYPGGRMSPNEMRAALQARIQAAEERLWFKMSAPPK